MVKLKCTFSLKVAPFVHLQNWILWLCTLPFSWLWETLKMIRCFESFFFFSNYFQQTNCGTSKSIDSTMILQRNSCNSQIYQEKQAFFFSLEALIEPKTFVGLRNLGTTKQSIIVLFWVYRKSIKVISGRTTWATFELIIDLQINYNHFNMSSQEMF